jgi:hypothetical protein
MNSLSKITLFGKSTSPPEQRASIAACAKSRALLSIKAPSYTVPPRLGLVTVWLALKKLVISVFS